MQEIYLPYFKAVKQILDGNPVKELDSIRRQCNEAFLKLASEKVSEQTIGYYPEAVVLSFIADAENKILMGADPIETYSDFQGLDPTEFRLRGRKLLEHAIQKHLK